jgi:DNA-directed RNA polymerase specialized sigma24 family protein
MTAPKQTPSSDKSLVIQKRLEGKSMNQIERETGISKGKVQYLINDWKEKIGSIF